MISQQHIKQYLKLNGIKHSHRGYTYLLVIITEVAENPNKILKLKDIYETVAKKFNEKPMNVYKSINYAIAHKNTTNKEFIAKTIDDIMVGMTENRRSEYIWWINRDTVKNSNQNQNARLIAIGES